MVDDDIPMLKFMIWHCLTQAPLRFHIPRPTRTRQLLIHNSEYRGRLHIAKDAWALPALTDRVPEYGRFVSEIMSKRLKDFSSFKEFYTIFLDVLQALNEGTTRCSWLHGDIRWDHMLIDRNGRGVLNDYDLMMYEKRVDRTEKQL
ncbi:hypothetical protein H2248_003452 [Termitomyces sp. 'cryptogamus']|nr:hypothetical protein H2248_003452 [Termitomyces sp. 'cryptogamus']